MLFPISGSASSLTLSSFVIVYWRFIAVFYPIIFWITFIIWFKIRFRSVCWTKRSIIISVTFSYFSQFIFQSISSGCSLSWTRSRSWSWLRLPFLLLFSSISSRIVWLFLRWISSSTGFLIPFFVPRNNIIRLIATYLTPRDRGSTIILTWLRIIIFTLYLCRSILISFLLWPFFIIRSQITFILFLFWLLGRINLLCVLLYQPRYLLLLHLGTFLYPSVRLILPRKLRLIIIAALIFIWCLFWHLDIWSKLMVSRAFNGALHLTLIHLHMLN